MLESNFSCRAPPARGRKWAIDANAGPGSGAGQNRLFSHPAVGDFSRAIPCNFSGVPKVFGPQRWILTLKPTLFAANRPFTAPLIAL